MALDLIKLEAQIDDALLKETATTLAVWFEKKHALDFGKWLANQCVRGDGGEWIKEEGMRDIPYSTETLYEDYIKFLKRES